LEVINAIIEPMGRRVDDTQPFVDARLPDGSRVNAVIPPVSLTGPTLTIAKFSATPLTLDNLVRFGSLSKDMVAFLRACVVGRLNTVVAGNLASGKTTLLNVLSGFIADDERVITVENAAELRLRIRRVVTLESRPPNIEGKGEVSMRDLIRNALRMRPDRIIVGEVRGGEALEVLQSMSTGHDGMMCSLHAGSVQDVLTRLETMALMGDPALPMLRIRQLVASALNLVVYQKHLRDGTRKVVAVAEVQGMSGGAISLQPIFEFRQTGFQGGRVLGYHTATGVIPSFFGRFRELGIDLPMSMFTPR
jgi:pilus assembly protein CpaF